MSLDRERDTVKVINPILYCVCFMLPSAIVTSLAAFDAKKFTVIDQLHLLIIQLANALFFKGKRSINRTSSKARIK